MDKLACSMMFQTIFFMILYGDISSQPLYENSREDQVTTKQTEFHYQKLYEREIFLENQVNNFKKELDICTDPAEARVFQHRCIYESYIYHEENVTKNQYCLIKSFFNWQNAKEKCQSFRSHLLEINTESEQIWLNDKVYGHIWWTGGVRDENGIDWMWNNSISKMVFTNWDTYQPDNQGEDYVVITSSGRWHDYHSNYAFYIICEMG